MAWELTGVVYRNRDEELSIGEKMPQKQMCPWKPYPSMVGESHMLYLNFQLA